MKPLHDIVNHIPDRLLWYGTSVPCRDSYHNGYEHEREAPLDHYDCATRSFRELTRGQGINVQTFSCQCETEHCRVTPERRLAHYFYVPAGQAYHEVEGIYVCEHCFQNQHPIFEGHR